jgi:hypothetical protein
MASKIILAGFFISKNSIELILFYFYYDYPFKQFKNHSAVFSSLIK